MKHTYYETHSGADGGAAFPNHAEWPFVGGGTKAIHWEGMTLRDYFAAATLAGLVTKDNDIVFDPESVAIYAYAVADQMLKARQVFTEATGAECSAGQALEPQAK